MTRSILIARLVAAGALSLPAIVAAQPAAPADSLFFVTNGAPLSVDMPRGIVTTAAPLRFDVLRGEGVVPGGVVKDKPYTADSITESTQVLVDGNRITHRNESRFYRDSQGRTRREQTVNALGAFQSARDPVTMITINDPVAEVTYFLDPAAHTARKLQPFRIALGENATFEQAVPPPAEARGGATQSGVLDNVGGSRSQDVTIVRGEDTGPLPFPPPREPGAPAVGVISIRAQGAGTPAVGSGPMTAPFPATDATTEDLGKQVLEGVLARGTRETITIPAGTVGNERPIEIRSETWYSDELEAIVLSKTSDPRFGETSYRLVNVVRAEPAPDLFAVPQGYEMQTDPGPPRAGVRVFGPGGPPPAGARVEGRAFLIEQSPPKPDK